MSLNYKNLFWLIIQDIQNLMGVLAYLPYGVHNSPYKRLFDPILWTEICEVFVKDACALLGFSVESPLSVWYVLFKTLFSKFVLHC